MRPMEIKIPKKEINYDKYQERLANKHGCKPGSIWIPGYGCNRKNQILKKNKLTVFYRFPYRFGVKTPDGRILEDRMTFSQAKSFAKRTKDFLIKK